MTSDLLACSSCGLKPEPVTHATFPEFTAYECPCGWRCCWSKSLELAVGVWNLRMINPLYNELLYAVGSKHKGETRHETALRYIRERENSTQGPGMDSQKTDDIQDRSHHHHD